MIEQMTDCLSSDIEISAINEIWLHIDNLIGSCMLVHKTHKTKRWLKNCLIFGQNQEKLPSSVKVPSSLGFRSLLQFKSIGFIVHLHIFSASTIKKIKCFRCSDC